jgi:hypothetical protein
MAQFSEGERFPMPRVAANISPMRAWSVVVLRWLLMIGVPVALAVVTLPRPTSGAYQDVYHGVGPVAGGYLLGYLLQLPLSGLLFVAALMLTRSSEASAACLAGPAPMRGASPCSSPS